MGATEQRAIGPESCGGQDWIEQELAASTLPVARLEKRLRSLVEQLAKGVGRSIPFACQDWAAAKAAYRFFSNGRVSEEQILAGHFLATRERIDCGEELFSHAAESLSVNLASVTGAAHSVGEGFLYGVSQDGTEPADQFLEPLGITGYRGGGHASSGWIGDGYTYGSDTQADVAEVIAQAKRLTESPYHAQYQVILSDVYGADGSQ